MPVKFIPTAILQRRLILRPALLLFFAGFLTTGGQIRSEIAPAAQEPNLAYDSWYMPLNAVSLADPTNAEGIRKLRPGFKALGTADRYDAAEFVAALGISSPPGSSACYSPVSRRLVVRDTRANLDWLNRIFDSTGDANAPLGLHITLSVFECDFGAPLPAGQPPGLAYKDFLSLPEENKRLLGSISGAATHGVRTVLESRTGQAVESTGEPSGQNEEAPSFKDGQSGIIAEFEARLGWGETTLDNILFFLWRGTETGGITPEIRFVLGHSGWENHPQILYLSSVENHPGRYRLVIGTCSIEVPPAWNLERMKATAKALENGQTPGP